MVLAALVAAPALAETRPDKPKGSGVIQKGQDTPSKAQPGQSKPKAPPPKTKPFVGGSDDGTGI